MTLRIKKNILGGAGRPSSLEYGELAVDGAGNLYVGDVNGVPVLVNKPIPQIPTVTLQHAYTNGNTISGSKPVVISTNEIPDLAQPPDFVSFLTFYNPIFSYPGIVSSSVGGMLTPYIGHLIGKHIGSTSYVGNYTDGYTTGVDLGQSLESLAGTQVSELPIPLNTDFYWMVALVEATDVVSDSGIYFVHRVDDIGAAPRSGILLRDMYGTPVTTFTSSTGRITLFEIADMKMLNEDFEGYQDVTVGRRGITKGIINEFSGASAVLDVVSTKDIYAYYSGNSAILNLQYGPNAVSSTAPFIRFTGTSDGPDILFVPRSADPAFNTSGALWFNDAEGVFKYGSSLGMRTLVFDLKSAAEQSGFSLSIASSPLTLTKESQGVVPATLVFETLSNGEEADIQLASRSADPTSLSPGQLWFRSDEGRLKFTNAASSAKSIPVLDEVALVVPGDAVFNKAEVLSPALNDGDLAIEEDSSGNIYFLYQDSAGVQHRTGLLPASFGGARPFGEISFSGNATAQSIGTSYTRVEGSYAISPTFLTSLSVGSGTVNGALQYDGDFPATVKVTCFVVLSDSHTDTLELAIAHYDASAATTTYLSSVKVKQAASGPWTVTLSTDKIMQIDNLDYFEIVLKGSVSTNPVIESASLSVIPV